MKDFTNQTVEDQSKLAVISRPGGKVVIEEKGLAKPGSGDAGG
jgi:hypothetical protein